MNHSQFFAFLLVAFSTNYFQNLVFGENPCTTKKIFVKPVPNKALVNHVISTAAVTSEEVCKIHCFIEVKCESYNFGPKEDGGHVCELSDSDAIRDPLDLITKEGFLYCETQNPCATAQCPVKARCYSDFENETYACVCMPGFTGKNCETPIDKCKEGLHDCHVNATCNTVEDSYNCTCKSGFQGDGKDSCEDIDECTEGLHGCHSNATCNKTKGSYSCTCKPGFHGDGKMSCEDIDECRESLHDCHSNATCNNAKGSYNCTCISGFHGDGKDNCEDIDECRDGHHGCHSNATCNNTKGAYNCTCKPGFHGDGKTSCKVSFLNTYIRSEGNDDPRMTPKNNLAYIFVNGKDYSPHRRGHNVVIVDAETGAVLGSKHFDTFLDSSAGDKLRDYLNAINGNKIVLVAIQDEGSRHVVPALDAFRRLGATDPFLVAIRASFAFAGYAESNKPHWITQEQQKRYEGPSEISLIIPLQPHIDECAKGLHGCHSNASCQNTEGSHNCTCKPGFFGNGSYCVLAGSAQELAVPSCHSLFTVTHPSGIYWVDPDGGSNANAFKAYCEMETDGGGWTLVWSYSFTDYDYFDYWSNAVTPRPEWPGATDAVVPVSATTPLNETDYNAMEFSLWQQFGRQVLIKSNINNWIVCSPDTGSLVEWQNGSVVCDIVKRVSSTCPDGPAPSTFTTHSSFLHCGPYFSGGQGGYLYYYFDGCTAKNYPTHDPCGNDADNGLKNVTNPHGNIFVR
ncbi:hypothetical protein ACROYT_G028291 [Oculina patagonica]